MTKAHLEIGLEDTVCEGLGQHGWLYADDGSDRGFDAHLGLYPQDVIGWLSGQYPDEFVKAVPEKLTGRDRERAEYELLKDLATKLDAKPVINRKTGQATGGLLGLMHEGFKYSRPGRATAIFGPLAAFPPDDPLTLTAVKRAQSNVLRVLRQVHFDTKRTKDTIDVVLLVNGIPVVTMELKTDATQNVIDAIEQYQRRKPVASARILTPGRCLVHFAVSGSEVYMTTKLAGDKTRFLPFNTGTASGHAGNDPVPGGVATEYLWTEVLERERFLRILNSFAFFEPKNKRISSEGTLIFPRFHQLRAVENVMADIDDNGPGDSYLIWHSAGSGKTKTIAWLAHRLIRHVSREGEPTFDSVILVSDRTVLDKNLREGVQMLRASNGLVVPIEKGSEAKSKRLNDALTTGNAIITCTLQTFPEVLDRIQSRSDLEGRRWAVIADEAHTSQTGKTANALRELLADADAIGDDEDEIAGDDLLLLNKRRTSRAANMTFVALTATPKPKTLQLFGTESDGVSRAFDVYTMAQAIEEGFILDVLSNYSTYAMYAKVAGDAENSVEVELDKAVSDVYKYVKLHRTAIHQKVQIVVEHFTKNVLGKLDGQARAMVVTSSRADAVRWALEMNTYLEAKGLNKKFQALVAFSESLTLDETGDKEYSESSMNGPGDVETKFKDDDSDYRVLIAANKFQTGFNEPRLIAMYVDKELHGVSTVQTLSRLNRTYPGKSTTMIVDFVNDPDNILADFQDYYEDAVIAEPADPTTLDRLGVQLDAYGYYDEADMDKITRAVLAGKDSKHQDFTGVLQSIASAWQNDLAEARADRDKDRIEDVRDFRKLIRKYVSAWEFLTQFLDFRDRTIHKRALLLSHLRRYLIDKSGTGVDYSSMVKLEGLSMQPKTIGESLELTPSGTDEWSPVGFEANIGGGSPQPELGPLEKVVEMVNEMMAERGLDTTDAQVRGFISTTWSAVLANDDILATVRDNSDDQLRNSSTIADMLLQILWTQRKSIDEIGDLVMFDTNGQKMFAEQILEELIRKRDAGEL